MVLPARPWAVVRQVVATPTSRCGRHCGWWGIATVGTDTANGVTGHLADRIGRKPLVVHGVLVQSVGFVLALVLLGRPLLAGIVSAVFLGLGTAMVWLGPHRVHLRPRSPRLARRRPGHLPLLA